MRKIYRHLSWAAALIASSSVAADVASTRAGLTLEAIFSPDKEVRVEFGGTPLTGLEWSTDGRRYLQPVDAGSTFQPPLVVDLVSGRSRPLFDEDLMADAFSEMDEFSATDTRRLLRDEVTLAADQKALLIQRSADLYHFSIPAGVARRLTDSPVAEEIPRFSPDGRFVSFVREHDLHSVEIRTGKETALTVDGGENLLNGKLDWVYQEEIYGRGDFQAHWWSPDSTMLAFLQLDESQVPRFTLVDHLAVGSATEIVHYPKAGDPNPQVRLGAVSPIGGDIVWIDTSAYADQEHLIVRVGWTPDSRRIVFLVQDRTQTWLDLNVADPRTGRAQTLLRETSPAFVDSDLAGRPHWLSDGSFVWLSARTGYHHLYRFAADGSLLRQLTRGDWEVRQIAGVDESTGWVYFSASEHSPIELHLYRARLDGSDFTRLTRTAGTHRVQLAPDFAHFLDTWSDIDTPPRISLHRADGSLVRTVDDNRVGALERLELAPVEFLQVPAPDGFVFEAAIIKPLRFDPAERYPVLVHNYGGPHAQTVKNAWAGSRGLWFRYLAQEGYVVWMCDNRSASAKGIWPTWEAWGRLGVLELADQESCLTWLKRQPWVDGGRIAVHGGSYGGFMAAFSLTHSRSFKVGIASAPVTDWHLYDTIYTERYMRLPSDNPDGYRQTSVVEAAGQLHGHLLLTHGTMDDNVHMQNTIQLAHALQQAGKSFELMLYPNSRHGIRDQAQIFHLFSLKTRFLREHL